jgi:hypothetical protein
MSAEFEREAAAAFIKILDFQLKCEILLRTLVLYQNLHISEHWRPIANPKNQPRHDGGIDDVNNEERRLQWQIQHVLGTQSTLNAEIFFLLRTIPLR